MTNTFSIAFSIEDGVMTILIDPGTTIRLGVKGVGSHIEYATIEESNGSVYVEIRDLFNECEIDANTFESRDVTR